MPPLTQLARHRSISLGDISFWLEELLGPLLKERKKKDTKKNWVNLAVIYSAFSQCIKVKNNWFIHYSINFWSLLPPLKANWDSSWAATC